MGLLKERPTALVICLGCYCWAEIKITNGKLPEKCPCCHYNLLSVCGDGEGKRLSKDAHKNKKKEFEDRIYERHHWDEHFHAAQREEKVKLHSNRRRTGGSYTPWV